MSRTPREIAELVRRMVEGRDGIVFADLFAADGVIEFPFAPPGFPRALTGQEEIREFYTHARRVRELIDIQEVTMVVHDTADPEVVITETEHSGISHVRNGPYRFTAVGVLRVRDGTIVHARDYMDPLGLAELTGRIPELVEALSATGTGAAR